MRTQDNGLFGWLGVSGIIRGKSSFLRAFAIGSIFGLIAFGTAVDSLWAQRGQTKSFQDRDPVAEFKKIVSSDGEKELGESVRQIALNYIPKNYTDEKRWGKKKQFTKYFPKKRKVDLNHGRWRKYILTFVEPEKNLKN